MNWDNLKIVIDRLKADGKKIVFTNGCFDIIHIGHIRYLREARKLGDVLIIGLNSDSSVNRLKPKRPINPESQRAEVLASLEMVDYVTIFDEDTPYELIKYLRPDVLVKGGDWKKEDIVGSDIVPEVHSLPYIEGISTTEIVSKIMSNNKVQMTNKVQNLNDKIYDLEERTARFGENIIELVKSFERNEVNRPLISQLVGSATSIGANYMEADGAESKKDFQHKIALCKKEAKETKHWLRMIIKASPQKTIECQRLWQEAKELTLIFSSILLPKKSTK